ncbi:MAG: hypothetical protein M1825_000077 [Sarcosagium campestre]|nr:MAG: hypothetical protein M1825_000077 [Sarcosagium campestre]
MFRNRNSMQKPSDELYANFRQSFPALGPSPESFEGHGQRSSSLNDASTSLDLNRARHVDAAPDADSAEHKDGEATPKGNHDLWRFTPSLLDPNSFAFASFANQPPGYYTPTPGGTNTIYHNQAGDLHTPSMGFGAGTPLSMPTSETAVSLAASIEMPAFTLHNMHGHHFNSFDPFAQPTSFAPSHFQNQPTDYEPLNASGNVSPTQDLGFMNTDGLPQAPSAKVESNRQTLAHAAQLPAADKFRFCATLSAPTAMIRHADEVPITYLNKGQTYSMSITDSAPPSNFLGPIRYRTFIRISFEDEQQRLRPAACWQLWKEGRGSNEAHQRGGRLQAVEFVDPSTSSEDYADRSRVQIETASFDGFSVTWSPSDDSAKACPIAVRFNFLSTDFSHSKGVKGIPVRLCAKTEMILPSSAQQTAAQPEVCFCKVKLFRDHGAERKLSNDIAHVKKTIEKLKQQISQAESGSKDLSKRRRSGPTATKPPISARPGKVAKHRRTWSMSSAGSVSGQAVGEEDLHHKLATVQDMFKSTRPVSVLHLCGHEMDDPDLHPVHLTGEPTDLVKSGASSEGWNLRGAADLSQDTGPSSTASTSSSSSQCGTRAPVPDISLSKTTSEGSAIETRPATNLQSSNPQHLASPPDQPTKVRKYVTNEDGRLSGWIEALGVDTSYKPPPEAPMKPVACIYVKPGKTVACSDKEVYRAIYLMQRTYSGLLNGIAAKFDINPSQIARMVHLNSQGLNIKVDDDVVRQTAEGQDMMMELVPYRPEGDDIKRELESGADDMQVDGEIPTSRDIRSSGYEVKLNF